MKVGENYFDLGAESIDIRYPEAMDLIKELGLMDQVVYSEGNKPDIFFTISCILSIIQLIKVFQ